MIIRFCVSIVLGSAFILRAEEKPLLPRNAAQSVAQKLCSIAECPFCVVHIRVEAGANSCTGTGVLLNDGRVITASHVANRMHIPGTTNVIPGAILHVIFGGRNGQPETDVEAHSWKYWDKNNCDLAVIKGVVAPDWAVGVPIANSEPKENDILISVGLETRKAVRVHCGEFVAKEADGPVFSMAVLAQMGDSGGPVFNLNGELVGINEGIGTQTQQKFQQVNVSNYNIVSWQVRTIQVTFVQNILLYDLDK
jgi:V8-like Glu-specific endopeptidase